MSETFVCDKTKFLNDCVRGNDNESMQSALTTNPELLNSADASGLTPFLNACFYGHVDMAAYLANANADVTAITPTKSTALHLAVSRNHMDVVQFLLQNCAVDVDAEEISGLTAEGLAKTDEMFTLLKSRGQKATILISNEDEDSD